MAELERRGPVDVHAPNAADSPIHVIDVKPTDTRVFAHADWVALTQDIAAELYAVTQRARSQQPPTETAEAHHLIIATTAIAATELEALTTLLVVGLHRNASIHARSVGILSRNAAVFSEQPEIAKACYDSLDASRKELVELGLGQLDEPELEELMEDRFADAEGDSMRKIEQTHGARFRDITRIPISRFFQNLWSKWNHGDIIALADAGDRIRADGDLHDSINLSNMLAYELFATTVTASILLLLVVQGRGFATMETIETFAGRYYALQPTLEPFRKQMQDARERHAAN